MTRSKSFSTLASAGAAHLTWCVSDRGWGRVRFNAFTQLPLQTLAIKRECSIAFALQLPFQCFDRRKLAGFGQLESAFESVCRTFHVS